MLLNAFQKTVVEFAKSKVKVGILLDKVDQATNGANYLDVQKAKEQLLGYVEVNLSGIGERGTGKTSGTIEAFTMAGLAALYINPAQWVDNADAVGMPKVLKINGKEVTKNVVRDFFPMHKLDENGKKMLRADGGYMIDFESVKDYIANYDDLMVLYKGDINQCPGLGVVWDEFNRIVAQDVQQLMYSLMLNHEIGDYAFPNGTLFVILSNPNTGDYNVSAILEEEAMKDRFCHITVENNLDIFNGYMTKKKFNWAVKALANAHPETVTPKGEDYDINIQPSNRSMEMLSSVMNFTSVLENLPQGDFLEIAAGLIGTTYAARLADIMEKGAERVPTGEEILMKYDEIKEYIVRAKENNRQDFLNQVKDNFLSVITAEDSIDKYQLRAKKEKDGTVIVPPSLDNVYKFFTDIPAEFRVAMVKMFVELPKVHPVIAMHQKLYDLVKEDIKRSNQKGKGTSLEKK